MPFTVPTQKAIVQRVLSDFRSEAGVNPLHNSIERALCLALAGQSKGQYSFQNFIFNQSFPLLAEEFYFWRWAAIWNITQKPGEYWTGVVRVTGVNGVIIPISTSITRSDGTEYLTNAAGTIGSLVTGYVDISITAVLAGIAANNDNGDPLNIAVTIIDADSEVTVQSTTAAGTDDEDVEDAKVRLLQRLQTPPSGGVTGDYVRWALEVVGVTRAWESSPLAGSVAVSAVRDDDGSGSAILPDSTEREAIRAYVQSKAPITVEVSVNTLTALTVNVVLSNLVPDNATVRAAITAELADFFVREAEPGGTIFLSRLREAISSATGETSHTLVTPAADVVAAANEVPIFGTLT